MRAPPFLAGIVMAGMALWTPAWAERLAGICRQSRLSAQIHSLHHLAGREFHVRHRAGDHLCAGA